MACEVSCEGWPPHTLLIDCCHNCRFFEDETCRAQSGRAYAPRFLSRMVREA